MCASISGPDSGSSGTGGGRVLAAVAKPPPDPQPVPTKVTGRTKAGMRSPGRNDAAGRRCDAVRLRRLPGATAAPSPSGLHAAGLNPGGG